MNDYTEHHHSTAEEHHHEVQSDVLEARAAVSDAVIAVKKADAKMDHVLEMLNEHFKFFRLGVVLAVFGLGTGIGLFYALSEIKDQAKKDAYQILVNEVEVLRHRVHSKDGDLRLCTVALGASRGQEAAAKICAPVLGPDYERTKKKLAKEERRLQELKEGL